VLDADVLIGALDGNDAHHQVARGLLTNWHAQQDTVLVSVVNLSEVLVAPAADEIRLRSARSAIAALGVIIHQPTEAIAVDAARLRSRHPINLPDSYLLASARYLEARVVSFDAKIGRAAKAERIATHS
jgi:predicted nucleic acid-binding protein